MLKIFSVLNNLVRIQINGRWEDLVEPRNPQAIQVGKHQGKLPDINSVDICFDGHLSQSDWLSTKAGKDGSISGTALLALATKVADARSTSDVTTRPLQVDENAVYQVVAKTIGGKSVTVRQATTKDGSKLSYVTFRIPKQASPAVECEL